MADIEQLHPAVKVVIGQSDEKMEQLVAAGFGSSYPLNPGDFHIHPKRISGRWVFSKHEPTSSKYKHWTSYIDMQEGKLKVNHTGNTQLWLEVQLPEELIEGYKAWKYHPDNPEAQAAIARCHQLSVNKKSDA